MFKKLRSHVGHEISLVMYGDENISFECENCCEVLVDFNSWDEVYYESEPVHRGDIK